MAVKPIPDHHSTVIPYLVVSDSGRLLEFLKAAFDAKEVHKTTMQGAVMHAHVRIGDSSVMMGQAPPGHALTPAMLYMYVTDVDAAYRRAVAAGATPEKEPANQFYGDRVGAVKDFAGNQWWLATHVEDISDEELARRAAARPK